MKFIIERIALQRMIEQLKFERGVAGVGRVNPNKLEDGPLPKCWANGYRDLHGKPLVTSFLKQFDRERERQIRRLAKAEIPYGSGSKKKGGKRKLYRPIRNEFSYHAQFKNEGSAELLKNPDNTMFTRKGPWGNC